MKDVGRDVPLGVSGLRVVVSCGGKASLGAIKISPWEALGATKQLLLGAEPLLHL